MIGVSGGGGGRQDCLPFCLKELEVDLCLRETVDLRELLLDMTAVVVVAEEKRALGEAGIYHCSQ